MRKHLFMIGPASVGKSTVGAVLAQQLGWPYIDLDLEFCKRIQNITHHIDEHGYHSYAKKNSQLFETLLVEATSPTVFATPAGFLAHESVPELVTKHLELLKANGISILLFPHATAEEGAELIAARQHARWGKLVSEDEHARYIRRFRLYQGRGDIEIASMDSPQGIAKTIVGRLKSRFPELLGL